MLFIVVSLEDACLCQRAIAWKYKWACVRYMYIIQTVFQVAGLRAHVSTFLIHRLCLGDTPSTPWLGFHPVSCVLLVMHIFIGSHS